MAQPVWVLSVDLQAKTATFETGLAGAARSARDSFKQVNQGAAEMGETVGRGGLDVRHALGLVDNTIRGAHTLAMTDLIRLFKDSALVMGALPFAMTVAGFALVAEMVVKGVQAYQAYKQAAEAVRDETTKFHTSIQETFNALDDRLLEAQKQADELSGNHLGALRKELELIDHQSLSELAHSFDTIAKAADTMFGDLKSSWYSFGIGSDGAKHALEQFQTQYDALLAQGKDKDANNLLGGTLASAQHVLAMMNQLKYSQIQMGPGANNSHANYAKAEEAILELKKAGVGISDKEVQSQQALVDALSAQVTAQEKVTALKTEDYTNARLQTAKEMTPKSDDTDSKVAEGRARMMQDLHEEYEQRVEIVQQGERKTIDETKQGSAERLQAIEDAMQREEADGLQDTSFYKELAIQKLEVQREIGQQQVEQAAAITREQADSDEKMGELRIAAEKAQQEVLNSMRHVSAQQQAAQSTQFANEEYQLKLAQLQREIEGLDQSGQEYLQKLQQLQDKEKQLTQQHENEITAIKEKAEQERNQRVLAADTQFEDSIARNLTQSIMRHQTWSKMLITLGDQVIAGMLENAIKSALMDDFTKEKDAAFAARKAFMAGMQFPFPANIVAAPVLAAGAFASVMAFQEGTDMVPGVGRGDKVPSMLEPGEGIVPGGVMDGLRNVARNGGFESSGNHIHLHGVSFAPTVHALDADGIDKVLDKHQDTFQKHFQKTLRRMNK